MVETTWVYDSCFQFEEQKNPGKFILIHEKCGIGFCVMSLTKFASYFDVVTLFPFIKRDLWKHFFFNILVICHRFKCYSQSLRLLFTFFIHVILIVNEKKIRCLLRQMLHRTLSIFWFVHQNALSLSLSRARHITFAYMYGFIFYSMSVRTLHIRLPYTAA